MELITRERLVDAFCEIGVRRGMDLEVHSSLGSFARGERGARVDGGAETVIAALKECLGAEGSLFMPALRLSPEMPLTEQDARMGILTKIKILPPDCDRSAMGIIADTFRKQPDTLTGEGVFRVSGWGRHADRAVDGGLDYAIHNGGYALLLGVDIYKLTAMHYVENLLPHEIGEIFAPGAAVNALYPPDGWMVETGAPPVKAWYKIQDAAYEKGLIREAMIGGCKAMFFRIWDVVGLYEQALRDDPFGLYGLRG